jgi:hypothetical protein
MNEPPAGGLADIPAKNQEAARPTTHRVKWGLLAAVWFAGVSLAWGRYFEQRAAAQTARLAAEFTERRLAEGRHRAARGGLPPGPAPDPARIEADVRALAFERFDDESRKRVRAILAHRLTALGFQPELQAFGRGINVVGRRPAKGDAPTDAPADAAGDVLVAAHFDTVAGSPGANDNATGLAVALEMARLFAAPETGRGLRIAFFDGEEAGLAGSTSYARSASRLAGLRVAIVLEMLGRTCGAPGCQRLPPDAPIALPPGQRGDFLAVLGDDVNPGLLPLFVRAAVEGQPPVLALPVLDAGRGLPDTRRSDHAPFWDAGVPAVLLTDTADLRVPEAYHGPADVADTLDWRFLTGNAQTLSTALAALLQGP